jgi:alkylation response protein AidB-like acyl-CoA dehydrogenase
LSSIKNPKTELIGQIIDGELLISFAHMEMNNRYEDHFVETKAFLEKDNWKMSGSKSFVINGDSADKVIISARIRKN